MRHDKELLSNNGKVVAVIQARMGSTRLRAKSLSSINGIPLIKRVVNTVNKLDLVHKIVVATSDAEEDDPLEAYCTKYIDCIVHRGSVTDVFSRFSSVATALENNDIIIRITADNIFYQKSVCSELLNIHRSNNNSYTGIKGLSHIVCEILSASILKTHDFSALTDYEKEHVTPYFINNPDLFSSQFVDPSHFNLQQELDSKLTVDITEDRERVERLLHDFEQENIPFTKDNLYDWLKKNTTNET